MSQVDESVQNYINETLTCFVYERTLQSGDHALDIGANRGDHTRCMSAAVGSTGVIHAFEPNVRLFPTLCAAGSNVRLWPFAASDALGTTVLFVPEGLDGWGSQRPNLADQLPAHKINQIFTLEAPIDAFLKEITSEKIKFIKIDVETREEQALKGMAELLSRSRAVVIFENPTPNAEQFLDSLGYTILAFDGIAYRTSTIGLANVVAIPQEAIQNKDAIFPTPEQIQKIHQDGLAIFGAEPV